MFPLSKGKVAKQAHVGLPDGTYEEEHGREAFEGRASHLYRSHPPTAWVRIEGDLTPRAYDLSGLKTPDQADASDTWQRILWNDDVATELIVQTMLGTAKMLRDTRMHPVEVREMVTSPGGTTIAAIRHLEQAGVRAAFLNAIDAARQRSAELAKGSEAEEL